MSARTKAIPTLLALGCCCIVASSVAAGERFAPLVDALATHKRAADGGNSWENLKNVDGIAWEATSRPGMMKGSMADGTTIHAEGTADSVSAILINVKRHLPEKSVFGEGNAVNIPTSCDKAETGWRVGLFQFTRPGKKAVYISYIGNMGEDGAPPATDYTLSPLRENALLSLNPEFPCTILTPQPPERDKK